MGPNTTTPQLSEGELESLLEHRNLLFMSVDVQGSTEAKRKRTGKKSGLNATWPEEIANFLANFSQNFTTFYAPEWKLEPARLWKTIGDEVVLIAMIRHPLAVTRHVGAFISALRAADASERPFKLKGTAWLAETPVGNMMIPLQRTAGQAMPEPCETNLEAFDYIGPQVDLGFRLSKLSSLRQMTVSADLAWLLLQERTNPDYPFDPKAGPPFTYSGRSNILKGILFGKEAGCPHVWIDLKHDQPSRTEDEIREDKLMHRQPADAVSMEEFCKEIITNHSIPNFLPEFRSKPDHPTALERSATYKKVRAERKEALGKVYAPNSFKATWTVQESDIRPKSGESIFRRINQVLPAAE